MTTASTGNIYQASLSYGLNESLKKTTGKSMYEHSLNVIEKKKQNLENQINKNSELSKMQIDFLELVKSNIEKSSKILDLSN